MHEGLAWHTFDFELLVFVISVAYHKYLMTFFWFLPTSSLVWLVLRWKEECSSIARKMELKMNDLHNELTRERRRNEELTRLLRDSRDKTIEVCVVCNVLQSRRLTLQLVSWHLHICVISLNLPWSSFVLVFRDRLCLLIWIFWNRNLSIFQHLLKIGSK